MLHHAQMPLDNEEYLAIFEYRGKHGTQTQSFSLIPSHRRMSDMCHSHSNPHHGRMSSLRRGPRIPPSHRQRSLSVRQNNVTKLLRNRLLRLGVNPPLQIVEESIMGPTAFVRLLTILATRDLFEKIPKWKKLPRNFTHDHISPGEADGRVRTDTDPPLPRPSSYDRTQREGTQRDKTRQRNELWRVCLFKRSRASSGFGCV